ncbi:hypothetical protein HU765_20320 [Pseudomonas sp. SWRI81]|uniref:Ig-like domain-containing protein n=1 Tax=Pseudomonas sp. SWRI81 TaxID=2745505 RepID=UPI00164558C7|nr:hypothetical protein [Pseudomonas sp. SWRI81]
MNPSAVNIAVVDGKTITQTQELRSAAAGEPVRIKAVRGGSYILAEGEKGVAPQNITVKRVGKDLHVSLEGAELDQPQLIIEDFYGSDSQLVGMAEDGEYHEYVASDADAEHEAAFLMDGDSSAQVLASDQLPGFGTGLVAGAGAGLMGMAGMGFMPAMLGLGALALGGVAYAVSNKSDGGNDHAPGIPPTAPIAGVYDNVGDEQGLIGHGGATDDRTPTFTGTGTPGNTVVIRDNGVVIGEVVVGEDGSWEFTPTTPLPEGAHNLVVVEKDPAGNEGIPSEGFELIVDVTAPGKSTISAVIDNEGNDTGPVANGGYTDDNRPTLTGTGEAGARIDVYANGVKTGSTIVNADGTWSYTPETAWGDGQHVLTTVAVDAAGNAGLPSDPYTIIIDTVIPGKGVIGEVVDQSGDPIGNGGATSDKQPIFNGGGLEPGDTVIIRDNGEVIGETIVDDDGNWSFTPDPALDDGNHEVVVVIKDPTGNEGDPSDPHLIIVDTQAPVMPGDGSIGEGKAFEGAWDDQDPIIDKIKPGDETNDARPEFKGVGLEFGDTVVIRNKGAIIGTTPVKSDGTWSWTPEHDLPEDAYSVDIVIRDKAGNESDPSGALDFVIDLTAPLAQAVVTSMGKDSGADSSDFVTNDGSAGRLIQGTLSAALAAGEKVQVSTDGGVTWLDALVDGAGGWSFIDQNSHSSSWEIQTRVTDLACNANASSQTVTVNTSVAVPDTVKWDGTNVEIEFNGSGLTVGSKIHLIIDGFIVEQSLSQDDIDAGAVSVSWSSADKGNSNVIAAAIVDTAGNVSSYVIYEKTDSNIIVEDFNSQSPTTMAAGDVIALSNFDFRAIAVGPDLGWGTTGFGDGRGWTTPSPSMAMTISAGSKIQLDMKSHDFSYMSMTIGDLNFGEQVTAVFYDQNNTKVYEESFIDDSPGGTPYVITAELPYGLTFSSVTLEATGRTIGAFWIDDIQMGVEGYSATGETVAEINQTITQGDVQYYGGEADNVFSLADVGLLAGSGAINGGLGVDTLSLTGTTQTLDLGIIGKLESIEIIDITGTGNNTLNLSLGDVLEQGETSLFTSDETVQMMVKGNAGDEVNLDDLLADGTDPGDWAAQGAVTVEGITYNVFQHSSLDAQLLVQDGVTTNLV